MSGGDPEFHSGIVPEDGVVERIGELLTDDPACGGRVTNDTIESIAALLQADKDKRIGELVEAVKQAKWFMVGGAYLGDREIQRQLTMQLLDAALKDNKDRG